MHVPDKIVMPIMHPWDRRCKHFLLPCTQRTILEQCLVSCVPLWCAHVLHRARLESLLKYQILPFANTTDMLHHIM